MSVLACDRNSCDNIMCDFYSSEHGYLCYDCRNELVETNGSMTISQFMNIPKPMGRNYEDKSWRRYVEDVFESRYE